jgi:hypothetical protein
MLLTYVHKDGTPVASGHCVMPDHTTTTFTITLRSNYPVAPDVLKRLLQEKYEVVEIVPVEATTVVR